MDKIIVSGMITVETTVAVDSFPLEYRPIDYNFYGIQTTVSGVGVNVSAALKALGAEPLLLSITGEDMYANVIKTEIEKAGLNTHGIITGCKMTPQSVIMYDTEGKRRIILDLKDIQEKSYPEGAAVEHLRDAKAAVLCNVNFSRSLLGHVKKSDTLIATDVHVVSDVNDEYNSDFMKYADILFMSNENIRGHETEFIKTVYNKYGNSIIVIGMGERGALLFTAEGKETVHIPAVKTREIVSTVGAGDALFTSFVYFYLKTADAFESLSNAVIFASWKIGEKGGASGFLNERELLDIKYSLKK